MQYCLFKSLIARECSRKIRLQNSIVCRGCDLFFQRVSTSSTSNKERNCRGKPLIQLFTKDDCSLCDIAKENLEIFKEKCDIEEIDISKVENSEWFEKYKYDIPVIHLNGKFLMKHKVFINVLEDALQNSSRKS